MSDHAVIELSGSENALLTVIENLLVLGGRMMSVLTAIQQTDEYKDNENFKQTVEVTRLALQGINLDVTLIRELSKPL
jgi:hypothetical protein